jgi:hypothetical protein
LNQILGISSQIFVKQFYYFHKEVLPCEKLINAYGFVIISSSVVGEQGYVILIQTGAELMFCHSFCFSIYQHFVSSFVYHFVYGLVLLCYLNQMQMI